MGEEGRARRREEGEDRIDLTSICWGKSKQSQTRSEQYAAAVLGRRGGHRDSLAEKGGKKKQNLQTNSNKPRRPRFAEAPPPAGALRGAGRKSARPWPLLPPPRARGWGPASPPPAPREPRRRVTDLQLSSLQPRAPRGASSEGPGAPGAAGARRKPPARHWGATFGRPSRDERPEDPPRPMDAGPRASAEPGE